jgi:hypothetical protein
MIEAGDEVCASWFGAVKHCDFSVSQKNSDFWWMEMYPTLMKH